MFSWLSSTISGGGQTPRDGKADGKLGSAQSRSTSPGSSTHPSEGGGTDGHSTSHRSVVNDTKPQEPPIPEHDFPDSVAIKNTFLHIQDAPGSFIDYHSERRIRSAPGSHIDWPEEEDEIKKVPDGKVLEKTLGAIKQAETKPFASRTRDNRHDDWAEREYPTPFSDFCINNTFVHIELKDAESLDKREVKSCPPSKLLEQNRLSYVEKQEELDEELSTQEDPLANCNVEDLPVQSFGPTPFPSAVEYDEISRRPDASRLQTHLLPSQPPPVAPPSIWPAQQEAQPPPPTMPPSVAPAQQPQSEATPIRLADALPEPVLGSAEYPTVGSKDHRIGGCKPCAFFHTRGCTGGKECAFCHLCPAGEKKKRQKEKMAAIRAAQAQNEVATGGPSIARCAY